MEAQQAALSPLIRFGTSTWAYEGWRELSIINRMRSGGSSKSVWPSMHGMPIAATRCFGRWASTQVFTARLSKELRLREASHLCD